MHRSWWAAAVVISGGLLGLAGSAAAHSQEWGAPEVPDATKATTRVEQGRWRWPLSGEQLVLRAFAAPVQPWSAGHRGVDLRAWETEVVAPADGVVRYAGWVVDRPVLSIEHDGVISSFEPVTASVTAGDSVTAGQAVGRVEPGHCAVRCVHMGVRVAGEYRNPLLWLGGVPRAVLLPTRSLE